VHGNIGIGLACLGSLVVIWLEIELIGTTRSWSTTCAWAVTIRALQDQLKIFEWAVSIAVDVATIVPNLVCQCVLELSDGGEIGVGCKLDGDSSSWWHAVVLLPGGASAKNLDWLGIRISIALGNCLQEDIKGAVVDDSGHTGLDGSDGGEESDGYGCELHVCGLKVVFWGFDCFFVWS
jgi:hypothetical protein